jgi:predicted dehydrogenase
MVTVTSVAEHNRAMRGARTAASRDRTRIGVIGCGLIAQVMHLPYLTELSDRFELAALCDVSVARAAGCGERYGVQRVHTSWRKLIAEPLDGVLIATGGNHAPLAIAAARAGMHVFVEKPMALCSRDAAAMVAAAEANDVRLMVGTMKRYDPAYERLGELLPAISDLRLVRVTTLESPIAPYVAHLALIAPEPAAAAQLAELEHAERHPLDAAVGGADQQTRWCYRKILLNTLVHELNMLGGLFGEPSEIRSVTLAPDVVAINTRFGDAECHLSWALLPGIARYHQELGFYASDQRLTLELPSPFLRSMPSRLILEGGDPGTARSWKREEIVSYEEAFKRELIEFSDRIVDGNEPRTSGADGLRDIRVAEAIARAHAARLGGAVSRARAY